MGRLDGKVAFITGGGSGIARAASQIFSREGAKVVLAELRPELRRAAEQLVREGGSEATFVETDVTSEDSVQNAISATLAAYGKLDVLYNSAGGSIVADGTVSEVDMSVWDHTISLDLLGTFLCCRNGIPKLVENGGGSIINMSSVVALRGSFPLHIYTSAKGGIIALTQVLAGTCARNNIRANAICPGVIMTDRVKHRFGESLDIPAPNAQAAAINLKAQIKASIAAAAIAYAPQKAHNARVQASRTLALKPMLSAIFFDFDGTLADDGDSVSEALNYACAVIRRRWPDIPTPELVQTYRHVSETAWGDYDRYLRHLSSPEAMLRAVWQETLANWGCHDPAVEREAAALYWHYRLRGCRPFSDVVPVLSRLGQRFHLSLLTNGAPSMQRSKVATSGLEALFQTIFVGGEFARGKPHPAIFEAALEAAGCRPEQAVHVGDSPRYDIAGAQAVGIHTVWLNRKRLAPTELPAQLRHQLERTRPEQEISSLTELQACIDRLMEVAPG